MKIIYSCKVLKWKAIFKVTVARVVNVVVANCCCLFISIL